MEIVGIVALLIVCAVIAVNGFGALLVVYGFGSRHTSDYVYAWLMLVCGVCGFIATTYFNISMSVGI